MFFIFPGDYLNYSGLVWGSLAPLVGTKWWGKVVAFDCLVLSQIDFILTKLQSTHF
jgi:hypothetical protein